MKRRITKKEYEQLAAFRYALRQYLHFSEDAVHEVGLTPQQHQALLAIKGYPGRDAITVGELAERLRVRHNSAVGLVDRLVNNDWVERQVGEGDRRQVYITLTDKGAHILEDLSAVHREELRRIAPQLHAFLTDLTGGEGNGASHSEIKA